MKRKKKSENYITDGNRPDSFSNQNYANFTIRNPDGGFVSVGGVGGYNNDVAFLCLNRHHAKLLFNFLKKYFEKFPDKK